MTQKSKPASKPSFDNLLQPRNRQADKMVMFGYNYAEKKPVKLA